MKITDGDTLVVLDAGNTQHKIRLPGIDATESNQPFGKRSKQALSALVAGQRVEVDWHKHDRYGRIVGKVIVQVKGREPGSSPDGDGLVIPQASDNPGVVIISGYRYARLTHVNGQVSSTTFTVLQTIHHEDESACLVTRS